MRIDSRALTQMEIMEEMNRVGIGRETAASVVHALAREVLEKRGIGNPDDCYRPTRDGDALVPGLMVSVGLLSVLACAGFWPGHKLAILGVSLAVGLLIFATTAIILPPYLRWMPPFLSLAGGAAVAVSFVRVGRPS